MCHSKRAESLKCANKCIGRMLRERLYILYEMMINTNHAAGILSSSLKSLEQTVK